MKRLLVTGASGFLGWNLCRRLKSKYRIIGTVWAHEVAEPGVTIVRVDLTRPDETRLLMAKFCPDAVIHAAAMALPDACEQYPDAARRINVEAAVDLARLCAGSGIPFVFTSTDMVFDGRHPPYSEDASVAPVNVYGRQKAEAEQRIMEVHPRATVCRLALMFGNGGPCGRSFIQPWLESLKQGQPLKLFTDEFRTPVSAAAAVAGLALALEQSVRGVLHLGGAERMSRFEFGALLARTFDCGTEHILAVRQADVPMAAARPRDVSFDSRRALALGYQPGTVAQQLSAVRNELEMG